MRTDVSLRCPRTAVDSQRPPGRRAAGPTSYVPHDETLRRLGLAG